MRSIVTVLTALLVLSLSGGCVRNSPVSEVFAPGSEQVAAAPTATVADFIKTYGENSVKADKEYAGKWVKLRGIISSIDKSNATGQNFYYVALRDEDPSVKGVIVCVFNFNREGDILDLKKGSVVTVRGRIDKLTNFDDSPSVTDCKVVN